MMQQNVALQPRLQKPPGASAPLPNNLAFDGSQFNLEPSQAAKQMAALTAANQARMAAANRSAALSGGGTNSGPFLGAMPPGNNPGHDSMTIPSFNDTLNATPLEPSMSLPNMAQRTSQPTQSMAIIRQRQPSFLNAVATFMSKRGSPLPPALTGIPNPFYDHESSPFKIIEPSHEAGSFKLAGKDINLLQFYSLIVGNGGAAMFNARNAWASVPAQLGLPPELPPPGIQGTTSTAQIIQHYYSLLLLPFEEMYRKNVQEQQKKAQEQLANRPAANLAQSRPPQPQPGGQASLPSQSSAPGNVLASGEFSTPVSDNAGASAEHELSDADAIGIKRKSEPDEGTDSKRARQRTDSLTSQSPTVVPASSTTTANGARKIPARRKIEYIPYAREVGTFGGRDLAQLEAEFAKLHHRRPIRDVNDWGNVDIDCLTLSIRSRLATELSYALTTFTMMSTMKGPSASAGFPIAQCPDLFEEILDLVEELAFPTSPAGSDPNILSSSSQLITNRELFERIHESQTQPFITSEPKSGFYRQRSGVFLRPADIIICVLNIIHNLSLFQDNVEFLARHPRLVDLLLKLCDVSSERPLRASVDAFTLSDVLVVRKETLGTLVAISAYIVFVEATPLAKRIASRIFQLVAAYLADPSESVPPFASVQVAGAATASSLKPPNLADVALEAFTRLCHSDLNRQVFAQAVPRDSLRRLLTALIHRLPVTDIDFQLVLREPWLSYLEKVIMAMYCLGFIAPPDLKVQVKADRGLGFKGVMLRMIQKFLMHHEHRSIFLIAARRTIETMKLFDDGKDSFDTSRSVTPTMSFGMGWTDNNEQKTERGTGLLGGHPEVTWDLLMLRDVQSDNVMFAELESLSRVD